MKKNNAKITKSKKKTTINKRRKTTTTNIRTSFKNDHKLTGDDWVENIVNSVGEDAIYSTEIKW